MQYYNQFKFNFRTEYMDPKLYSSIERERGSRGLASTPAEGRSVKAVA